MKKRILKKLKITFIVILSFVIISTGVSMISLKSLYEENYEAYSSIISVFENSNLNEEEYSKIIGNTTLPGNGELTFSTIKYYDVYMKSGTIIIIFSSILLVITLIWHNIINAFKKLRGKLTHDKE